MVKRQKDAAAATLTQAKEAKAAAPDCVPVDCVAAAADVSWPLRPRVAVVPAETTVVIPGWFTTAGVAVASAVVVVVVGGGSFLVANPVKRLAHGRCIYFL